MNTSCAIHEDRMNRSGTILPRVRGGVGVGVGVRGGLACMPLVSLGANGTAARHLTSQPHAAMHGSLRSREFACQ